MTRALSATGGFRAAALSAFLALVASLGAPEAARAAFVKNINLGNISENAGITTLSVTLEGGNTATKIAGQYMTGNPGKLTTWEDPIAKGDTFTLNYRFSLYDRASLQVFGGKVGGGLFTPYPVTLSRTDGTVIHTGSDMTWNLANLKGGDYILSFTGKGTATSCFDMFNFSMIASGGDPMPDVPLPGALLLLGSAVVGAGALGRKKARPGKAA